MAPNRLKKGNETLFIAVNQEMFAAINVCWQTQTFSILLVFRVPCHKDILIPQLYCTKIAIAFLITPMGHAENNEANV